MKDIMEAAQETFISESLELLVAMEDSLHLLRENPEDGELINSVFRAAHTIKGSAGLFGIEVIVAFAHNVESVLDQIRNGKIKVSSDLIDILLECRDHTESLIENIGDHPMDSDLETQSKLLLRRLNTCVNKPLTAIPIENNKSVDKHNPTADRLIVDRIEGHAVDNDNWHISLRFHTDVLRNGMEPLSFLRYLGTLGEIVNVISLLDGMPDAAVMDPESCYLGMEIAFKSDADKRTIENVFEFIVEESTIHILPPYSKLAEYAELIDKLTEEDCVCRIGELLTQIGALTEHELEQALNYQSDNLSSGRSNTPLGELLVEKGSVHPETVSSALVKQKKSTETRAKENKSIRVDAERLDQLINLVGELVIAGAGTSLLAKQQDDSTLLESVSLVLRLVEDIRDRSLRLRMVPIAETFNRFNRVVRDVAKETGKSIKLVIDGADTELDKSVVEKIGDPLVHLVRNAIDHGIEHTEQRLAAGKPAQGTVKLNAFHDSGNVVIEVSDDGGGIDSDTVLAKAIANGLVTDGQALSRPEILRLILEAGLSTKEAVSNLSGRGVGMDVVTKNVEALRGSVEVSSEQGLGTSIRVRLPLTLSIIDGFLVSVGRASYVIPLDSVVECIEYDEVKWVNHHGGNHINLRGEVLPYLKLCEVLDKDCVKQATSTRKNIVVVKMGDQKAGLVVDTLKGEYQTVIKPLSQIFSRLKAISGSTILGSGEVAMILDIAALIKEAEQLSRG